MRPHTYVHVPSFQNTLLCHKRIVSVLGGEEGYAAKYGLNRREFPRAQPDGTPETSPNMNIISFLKVTLWPFSVLPSDVGLYWKS